MFTIPASSETQSVEGGAENPINASTAEKVAADSETTTANGSEEETDSSAAKESRTLADPIRWFGILVPPALRAAQASFVSGVEGSIPQLATLAAQLRRQGVDIGRLRKQIKKL
jgi:hypothetical protein